jgi:hypothetical protein
MIKKLFVLFKKKTIEDYTLFCSKNLQLIKKYKEDEIFRSNFAMSLHDMDESINKLLACYNNLLQMKENSILESKEKIVEFFSK